MNEKHDESPSVNIHIDPAGQWSIAGDHYNPANAQHQEIFTRCFSDMGNISAAYEAQQVKPFMRYLDALPQLLQIRLLQAYETVEAIAFYKQGPKLLEIISALAPEDQKSILLLEPHRLNQFLDQDGLNPELARKVRQTVTGQTQSQIPKADKPKVFSLKSLLSRKPRSSENCKGKGFEIGD